MNRFIIRIAVFMPVCLLSLTAFGQSMARLAQDPWNGTDFVSTYDHPIFENTGHVKNSNFDANAEV